MLYVLCTFDFNTVYALIFDVIKEGDIMLDELYDVRLIRVPCSAAYYNRSSINVFRNTLPSPRLSCCKVYNITVTIHNVDEN